MGEKYVCYICALWCPFTKSGNLSDHARELLFSANLTALRKKDSEIRAIAVDNVFHRRELN